MTPVIPLDEARSYVRGRVEVMRAGEVVLPEALGCILAEAVIAHEPVPPFANSAMDGFALRSADALAAHAVLRVVGTTAAGASGDGVVGAGEAMRIMTGAPMPAGADAVAPVEICRVEGDTVVVGEAIEPGRHVRPAGDDMVPGDVVVRAGSPVTPGVLGVCATLGRTRLRVIRRPVVGVISTGDELVDGSGALAPGQIRDSNRVTLLAMLTESGFDTVDLGLVRDEEGLIEVAVRGAVERCDALVTSGGVSMGDYDYVKAVLGRIGDMRWMQVAIRPAKPLAFGTVNRADGTPVPVFGLPGNPVSSMVSYELFARPALRRMAGHPDDRLDRMVLRVRAAEPILRSPDGKLHLDRVVLTRDATGELEARSAGGQGSHHSAAMANADALALIPDGEGVEAGGWVDVIALHPI